MELGSLDGLIFGTTGIVSRHQAIVAVLAMLITAHVQA
jgi:hypothetical protein